MRQIRTVGIGMLLLSLFMAGCASIKVYPIQNDYGSTGRPHDDHDEGVRFYRPAPHVWITKVAPPDEVNIITRTDTPPKRETTDESATGV